MTMDERVTRLEDEHVELARVCDATLLAARTLQLTIERGFKSAFEQTTALRDEVRKNHAETRENHAAVMAALDELRGRP